MASYYVDNYAQKNGDHKVHVAGCAWLTPFDNSRYLGDFECCLQALKAAKGLFAKANGCMFCSVKGHSG